MKPIHFNRYNFDPREEARITGRIIGDDVYESDFGREFSRFTTSVLMESIKLSSTFDGCSVDSIVVTERAHCVSGEAFWLGKNIADTYRFDLDKANRRLYSWKFFKGFEKPRQVLYIAKMPEYWCFSAAIS